MKERFVLYPLFGHKNDYMHPLKYAKKRIQEEFCPSHLYLTVLAFHIALKTINEKTVDSQYVKKNMLVF